VARTILDTSVLIRHWNTGRGDTPLADVTERDVRGWADRLIELHQTKAIVTPVSVEMIAGVRSKHELKLLRAFLARFEVIDERRIPVQDWQETERIAQRVPRDGKPRQMGDCLIRAIANRLRCDVIAYDDSFPG
jgi:predicted nucleic acid-binding protein